VNRAAPGRTPGPPVIRAWSAAREGGHLAREPRKRAGEHAGHAPQHVAVVPKDVPQRMLVVGNPARLLREVPNEDLLENA